MNFIFVIGPPAVGKMTVGQKLAEKLNYRFCHNHISIEVALTMYDFGTPAFKKINEGIRKLIFDSVAEHEENGFIFTFVWAFDEEADREYIENIKKRFRSIKEDWNFYFLELYAPLEIRLERNNTPNRLKHKASKRDIEYSNNNILEMEKGYVMSSDGHLKDEPRFVKIDNSNLSPEEVAERVIKEFDLH